MGWEKDGIYPKNFIKPLFLIMQYFFLSSYLRLFLQDFFFFYFKLLLFFLNQLRLSAYPCLLKFFSFHPAYMPYSFIKFFSFLTSIAVLFCEINFFFFLGLSFSFSSLSFVFRFLFLYFLNVL